jgi:hypothetical protein
MADGGTGQVVGPERGDAPRHKTADVPEADAQLATFVEAARDSLRARGVGGGRKGRAISARVDPELLAAAGARLGVTSQTEVLNAGLAVLAGADTFGAWLLDQAGALEADLDVDV